MVQTGPVAGLLQNRERLWPGETEGGMGQELCSKWPVTTLLALRLKEFPAKLSLAGYLLAAQILLVLSPVGQKVRSLSPSLFPFWHQLLAPQHLSSVSLRQTFCFNLDYLILHCLLNF